MRSVRFTLDPLPIGTSPGASTIPLQITLGKPKADDPQRGSGYATGLLKDLHTWANP